MARGWLEVGMGTWVRAAMGEGVLWWMIVGLVVAVLVNLWVGVGRGMCWGWSWRGRGVWSVG